MVFTAIFHVYCNRDESEENDSIETCARGASANLRWSLSEGALGTAPRSTGCLMPPATIPVGPTPWSQAATEASTEYQILTQFDTPKDININVSNSLWPGVAGLPDRIKGKVLQWQKRPPTALLKIDWEEPDGTRKWDTDTVHTLLAHGLKLETGPRGEALHLRGAARQFAQAAQAKATIDVSYTVGAVTKVQTWTVEPDPEAISVDARTEPRTRATINRRPQDVDTPYKMWRNGMLPPKLLDTALVCFNLRLDGRGLQAGSQVADEVTNARCRPAQALPRHGPPRLRRRQAAEVQRVRQVHNALLLLLLGAREDLRHLQPGQEAGLPGRPQGQLQV
jgi:hypothetical protein